MISHICSIHSELFNVMRRSHWVAHMRRMSHTVADILSHMKRRSHSHHQCYYSD